MTFHFLCGQRSYVCARGESLGTRLPVCLACTLRLCCVLLCKYVCVQYLKREECTLFCVGVLRNCPRMIQLEKSALLWYVHVQYLIQYPIPVYSTIHVHAVTSWGYLWENGRAFCDKVKVTINRFCNVSHCPMLTCCLINCTSAIQCTSLMKPAPL